MDFRKQKIADADMGYVVSVNRINGEERILVASEGPGPALMIDDGTFDMALISGEPGGCMGFADVPGHENALFMITRFYPIFRSEQAGIELCTRSPNGNPEWCNRRIADMPFVHRISSAKTAAGNYLFASTVCGGKDYQDDWSKAGAVYAIEIPSSLDGIWTPIPILEGLHRNHGMVMREINGHPVLYISADEGVFEIPVPRDAGDEWSCTRILDSKVSELDFIDINGDGELEMITIEPFHGDTIRIYGKGGGGWLTIAESPLNFGHGLSVGTIGGEPSIVVGNRSGSKELVRYRMDADQHLERTVLDTGSGTAGSAIINRPASDMILASNPEFKEYAAYIPSGGSL